MTGESVRSRTIGRRYELVGEISAGGMGQVWRGYDTVLDREVAIKLILPEAVSSAEHAEVLARRFRREARITARINHPGVPQVYDAVLDEDFTRLFLVMELVRGTPLTAFISQSTPLPVSWAAAVVAQICTVLSHAHAIPVVHRDLKPDNLMVAEDGTVKVLDFGIAAILRTDVTRLTATGLLMGTTRYMSPEQIQAIQVTPQSDLYAVGCILYELLAGRPVFQDSPRLMQQHLFEAPLPLRGFRPDVPADLEYLTLELLEKLPEQRPADAQEVFERLVPFLPSAGARPSGSERAPAGIPDPTRPYRNPCAPRRRPEQAVTEPPAEESVVSADEAVMAIKAAVDQSDDLLADDRFTQAADVLRSVLEPAAAALGADNHHVLSLRQRRAAILVIGGDFRRALPEFDRLAEAYARVAGPDDIETLGCRRQAALCRAELGQGTAALEQLRQVLARYRAAKGDGDETVLELRRDIGALLAAEGHVEDAVGVLQPLEQDLNLLYGPAHSLTREVRDLLARLRLTSG
ncbi:protein kinase [Planobispora rosea]|uniref:non-specific serine/threonine protein kinase n=1 Tax=Planobispora rosea TaxID=35762 RepID=A0A8J3WF84_PLARO|nr:serine/threonine-protein kinase [Planobispora rosea]GGS97634.1 protein kinase [Planobispora rosea]GIH87844.1 protein kinase [Planobispora rosea]